MLRCRKLTRVAAALAAVVLSVLILGPLNPAAAAVEDVAMFYDDLAQYGNWIDYGNYGPVWSPSNVSPNWRPYVDGRWVPTSEGWTFETSEPWGWATYHFGNWMPTTDYGWVWSPGSTWYPSTAAWRTSDDYVGWAPIPPPNYVPEPAFYPQGGYNPGAPVLDLLSAPFWVFSQAASFLLGFGQPYAPNYSYYNCNCLAPFNYGPVVFGSTYLLSDFFYPGYARLAYYCFGPPFPYVSRVCNIDRVRFNRFVDDARFNHFHNVLPPNRVYERHAYFRDAIPGAVREGRGFEVHRAENIAQAEHGLNHPRVTPAPGNVPPLSKEIAKVPGPTAKAAARRTNLKGVRGMGLPAQATGRETPQMSRQLRQERRLRPQTGPYGRMETRPEFRHPVAGQFRPGTEVTRPTAGREFKGAPGEFGGAPEKEFRAPAAARRTPTREFRGAVPQREFRAPRMPREVRPAPRAEFRAPAPRAAPARSAPASRQAPSGGHPGGHPGGSPGGR
jgi:hypothetical protein